MRLTCLAFICGTLAGSSCVTAAETIATPADVTAGPLVLHECRLEHPLRLSSVAARCGVLKVAEDPAQPAGLSIALSVAVVPALNRRAAAAPLFLLAGGPGQSAAGLYASYAGAFAKINRNHDIVLVDQRGTGQSGALTCDYPQTWESTIAEMPALREATLHCLKKFGDRVRFYTSSVAVRDLDQVRRSLGYRQIDLYGSSYGTRIAQLYMRHYGRATHAVILDGVTYPEQAIGPETPSDGERALQLIVTRCEHSADCSSAYPLVREELRHLRARFGPEVQRVTIDDPSSGLPLTIDFNRSMLNAALRFLSYNATEASLLPALLHQAALGRLAALASQSIMMARQVDEQLAVGMQNSVICSEDEPLFANLHIDRPSIAQTYQGLDQLDGLSEICKIWPRGPVDHDLHDALRSDIPTLLLSGEADPVTPPKDAQRAARALSRHRHLVLSGEGHGQIAAACVAELMAKFLDTADPQALDATCLERHRTLPFFVTLNGPPP